jgi:hypothetical protein
MKEPVELAPSADAGEPLAEHIRRRLERLLGRPLDDVRVHDHAQAERLTRQLGAEAFTLGRHIYVGRGVAAASTRQALGLLAHESTHAVQQTNPTSAAPGGERAGLPLVQRTRAIQRTSEEQEATDVEVAAQRPAARPQPAPIDPDLLTERVYKLLMREARRERERQARA